MKNADRESETIIERTLTEKSRMNSFKERIAETERVKETKRARGERGAGNATMKPGSGAGEQMAVRHADESGGDVRENQHEEQINIERHPSQQKRTRGSR